MRQGHCFIMGLPTVVQAYPPMDLDELVANITGFPALSRVQQRKFIETLVTIHPTLNLHWGPGHHFRRVRRTRGDQLPASIDDIINPDGVSTKAGRANTADFGVVYLADRQDTALQEARIDRGWVLIADFEIRPGHTIFVAPVGELFQIVRTGRGFLSGEASQYISEMLNACEIRDSQSLIITDTFLYEQMVGHDDYALSSCVARAIFNKIDQVSAIAYSSRRQLGAINLAVKAETFWRNWGMVSARKAFATHLALGFYKLSDVTHVTGVYKSGRFEWSENSEGGGSRILLAPPYHRRVT